MATAARKTNTGPHRSRAKRKPPGKGHATAIPPLPARLPDEFNAAAGPWLAFDIGESRRDKPVAAFDPWPVDEETGGIVDDPCGKATRRPVGS